MVHKSQDWMHSICGNIEEQVSPDMPTSLGKLYEYLPCLM